MYSVKRTPFLLLAGAVLLVFAAKVEAKNTAKAGESTPVISTSRVPGGWPIYSPAVMRRAFSRVRMPALAPASMRNMRVPAMVGKQLLVPASMRNMEHFPVVDRQALAPTSMRGMRSFYPAGKPESPLRQMGYIPAARGFSGAILPAMAPSFVPLRPKLSSPSDYAFIDPAFVQIQLEPSFWQPKLGNFPGKETIDAAIFDMDGTLLDSLPAWDHACAKYLRTQGISLPPELEQEIVRMSLTQGAVYVKEKLRLTQSAQEILEGTLALVRHHYATDILPKVGAVHLLKLLHEQGVKICVATSSDRVLATLAFERLGMMPYIDFIVTCDEVGAGKDSALVYKEALRRLGTSKERTLVVEDALYAIRTAHKAGFPTAAVADPLHSAYHEAQVKQIADYFFNSLEDGLE